ncbi:transposase [Nocardia sp. NPDC059091]|uniref:transposase n=1 Tax=unclassified Nocardia TaxID=2637762 RepID=UPI00367FB5A3
MLHYGRVDQHPCEQGCGVLSVLVTAGQAGDSPQFAAVLDAIAVPKLGGGRARVRPQRVLADKAYSSRSNREWLRRHGIRATIPVPADQADQTASGCGHQVRQTRRPLPGHHQYRRHQPIAATHVRAGHRPALTTSRQNLGASAGTGQCLV